MREFNLRDTELELNIIKSEAERKELKEKI